MTNHWIDMINADVVLIMGGNPAEDHPIAMNWLTAHQGARRLHPARRPALQSHELDRRCVRQAALGHRHRLRGRHDPVRHRAQPHPAGVRPRVHQRLLDRRRGLRLHRRPVLRLRSQGGALRPRPVGLRARRPGPAPARSHPQAPALRLPAAGAALRPLRRRHGVPHHGHPEGSLPAHLRHLHLDLRARPRRHLALRHGDGPAQPRHPEHPLVRDLAAAARQHRGGRRRRQRHARRVERAGVHGPGTEQRHPARLSQGAGGGGHRSGDLPQARDAGRRESGERELAAEHAEVRREPAQGLVGRARPPGERLRLFLPAPTGRRLPGPGLRVPGPHPRHAGRGDQGAVLLRPEPRGGRRQRAPDPGRARQARMDGRRRSLRARDGGFLEAAGRGPRQDPDRGVRAPRRLRRGEGGQHRQQRPLGAVALPRREAHRRQPSRPRHRRRAGPGHPEGVREGRGVPGADPAPGLGLRPRARSAPRRA